MAEILTLTNAVPQMTTTYTVSELHLATLPALITVIVTDNLGNQVTNSYTGATATALLHQLNIGNFSVNSLQKAIINRLVADGFLPAGSVSGTPA